MTFGPFLCMAGIESEKTALMPQIKFEKKYGQSPVFIASTLLEQGGVPPGATSASLLKEAIHVISCGYEDKTEWGKEIGWIYGSVTEDILTGFKMHSHGWRSVYCIPKRPAFKGSAPINLSDRLHQFLRWALGSVEILLSRHCPICLPPYWEIYRPRGEPRSRHKLVSYLTDYSRRSCEYWYNHNSISNYASLVFMGLFISIAATSILEMQWGGLLKVLAGVNTNFTVTSKAADDGAFSELYLFKWTSLLIPPMTLMIINLIGVVVGFPTLLIMGTNRGALYLGGFSLQYG
ncbi:hypothetical protein BUALT_BualtUnG0057000 [Buddleja alternifolia]|uniref:Cellulose synthase n=1 Tax=Buddleja alternifolia TaxID=168488 RepID=A0AAV6W053_9LAMI|nr:hypothetical protein BUALT_BualtUnG0057000 [Buddleja alternifolia]